MDFQVVTAAAACCGSVALGGVLHRLKPLANSDAAGMRNGRRAGLRLALLLACLAGLVGTTAGRWPPLAVTVLALPVLVAGAFRTRRVIAECARVRPARADLPARESPSRSRVELCPACQGTGRKKAIGRRQRDCGRCNGSGLSPGMNREQILKLAGICPACGGKGSYWLDGGVWPRGPDMPKLEACGTCKGSGRYSSTEQAGGCVPEEVLRKAGVCPACMGRGSIRDGSLGHGSLGDLPDWKLCSSCMASGEWPAPKPTAGFQRPVRIG